MSGQSRDVLSIPGYLVFKDPGIQSRAFGVRTIQGCPQYPGILSIQGSRDPGYLVLGQSCDVLSILGYLVFKDPGHLVLGQSQDVSWDVHRAVSNFGDGVLAYKTPLYHSGSYCSTIAGLLGTSRDMLWQYQTCMLNPICGD